jgi:hypothetical protein
MLRIFLFESNSAFTLAISTEPWYNDPMNMFKEDSYA